MPLINATTLASFKNQFSTTQRAIYFSRKEKLFEARTRRAATVFLSHSHSDAQKNKDAFEGAITLLSGLGVEVYVDWKDESMPKITDAATAEKLKTRIKDNKKFVLLASPQSIQSNWVNWELGLGDAAKYIENIALLPFVTDNNEWKDAEYLKIYPYIEQQYSFMSSTDSNNYIVRFPNGTTVKLVNWIQS